jgi:NAD dependent epimerase/dehydratase family enzyme
VAAFFQWLIDTPGVDGVINLAAPNPVPETDLMKALRDRIKPLIHFNVPAWMLPFGAILMRSETELVLKSRRVVPTRALQRGYRFHHSSLGTALDDLLRKDRAQHQ